MHTPRIFVEIELAQGCELQLDKVASHHLVRVLRSKPGEKIILFNGRGGEFQAEILAVNRSLATVSVKQFFEVNTDPILKIHLGQGISRAERMDYCIQKSVELGVTEITPLFTEKCNVKIHQNRLQNRMQHWQRIMISACEQSGRTIIPTIYEPIALNDWMKQCQETKFVCDPCRKMPLLSSLSTPSHIQLLIGPEGGLSNSEINESNKLGFLPLNLGPRILRTETAPVVAITLLQSQWGDLPR